jgi:hypothetical protein
MKGGVRFSLAGMALLLALAGCGRGFLQYGERAAWRHQAEVLCLKSGAVKIGYGVVQLKPIEGPGVCGADFPLKVAALGESNPAIGFADELRPPASIPNASTAQMPRWPGSEPRYAPPAPVQVQPVRHETMRWVTGPPPINAPQVTAPASQPMSLSPPGAGPSAAPSTVPNSALRMAPVARVLPDDIPDDAIIPAGGSAAVPESPRQGAYNAPVYRPPPQRRALPRLGPMRGPATTAAIPMATLKPAATLACPIVSALDHWVSEGVQPAALHWFGTPVVEIKQISAYACRSMVGAGTSHISEHAFGNALDIAGFTLADGRKITVKDGWHGTPEEQGFLHDVQLYACETFTTVLAPGYNAAHYNHIHVDLMRRASGRRPCRPTAIPGEVVAARLRARYASRHRSPAYTGSIATQPATVSEQPAAVPGADGYIPDDDDDATVTGSIGASAVSSAAPGAHGEFDSDNVTGSIPSASPAPAQNTARPEDRQTQIY